ncbi:uncharacterized protein LOC62_06G007905 [Vanrija pseudolonga]|uniref:Uncharacterized protein n=1 Tax=Vanrija pseudolonga TaxID=143232 RepID=A0AAF0YDF3_9TREE|nr:hypothetical protein LOC62_06G007905 [Vanrija pseudolonga]
MPSTLEQGPRKRQNSVPDTEVEDVQAIMRRYEAAQAAEPDDSPYKLANYNKRRKQQQSRRAHDYVGSHLDDEPDLAASTTPRASSSTNNYASSSTDHHTLPSTATGPSQSASSSLLHRRQHHADAPPVLRTPAAAPTAASEIASSRPNHFASTPSSSRLPSFSLNNIPRRLPVSPPKAPRARRAFGLEAAAAAETEVFDLEAAAAAESRKDKRQQSSQSESTGMGQRAGVGRASSATPAPFDKGKGKGTGTSKDTAILLSSSDTEDAVSGDTRHAAPDIVKPVPRRWTKREPTEEPLFLPGPRTPSLPPTQNRGSPSLHHRQSSPPPHRRRSSPPPPLFPISQKNRYRTRSPSESGSIGAGDEHGAASELFGGDVGGHDTSMEHMLPTRPTSPHSELSKEDAVERLSSLEDIGAKFPLKTVLPLQGYATKTLASYEPKMAASKSASASTATSSKPTTVASAGTTTSPPSTSTLHLPSATLAERPALRHLSQETASSATSSEPVYAVPSPYRDAEGHLAYVIKAITRDFPSSLQTHLLGLVPDIMVKQHEWSHARLSKVFHKLFEPARPFVLDEEAAAVLLATVTDSQTYLPLRPCFKFRVTERIAAYLVRRRLHSADTVELPFISRGVKPSRFADLAETIFQFPLYIDEEKSEWPWQPTDPGGKPVVHCVFPSVTTVILRETSFEHLCDYPEDLAGFVSIARPTSICFDVNLKAMNDETVVGVSDTIAAIVQYAGPDVKGVYFHEADTIFPNAGGALHYWLYCSPSSTNNYKPTALIKGPDGRKVRPDDAWAQQWSQVVVADLGRFARDKDDHKKRAAKSTYEVVYRRPRAPPDLITEAHSKMGQHIKGVTRALYTRDGADDVVDGEELNAGMLAMQAGANAKKVSLVSYGPTERVRCPGCSQTMKRDEVVGLGQL